MKKLKIFRKEYEFPEMNYIQWFPGHMYKTTKEMNEKMNKIDIIIEMRDSRIPFTSGLKTFENKKRIILFTKSDLSNNNLESKIQNKIEYPSLFINSIKNRNYDQILPLIESIKKDFSLIMVMGYPNIGKSTFINNIIGKNKVKVGPLPGVTKGMQAIKLKDSIYLIDSPGLLIPKIENIEDGFKLGLVRAIPDKLLHQEQLADYLLFKLNLYQQFHYINECNLNNPLDSLYDHPNPNQFSSILLSKFRNGKLGKITLDTIE